ncbi:CU044_5270 family protein [Nocardiopsis flavescens]|uniref:CU044_5270 family protein n=1 Tax=Nocardiopsis flavescens TaxID=758803 RepID=UPI00365B4BA3
MNELDHLRTLRSQIPERTSEELALLTGWRPGGGEFRSARRPRVLPLALSGIALVAAAALLLALVVFPGSLTVGVGPAVDPSEEVTEEVEGDPMETMGPLIEKIGAQEQTGTVWYTRSETTEAIGVGPADDPYAMLYRITGEHWRNTALSQSSHRGLDDRWEPASEEQRAAWERDGSPQTWTESTNGDVSIAQEHAMDVPGPPYKDWYYVIGDTVQLEDEDLAALPTDPDGLRGEFGLGTAVRPGDRPLQPYFDAAALPTSPEVRAGIYEMIAQAPEVAPFEGEDVLGRPAVGISQVADDGAQGRFEQRLLFDPETAELLSYETIVITPPEHAQAWQRPGEHARYVAYEESRWTSEGPP